MRITVLWQVRKEWKCRRQALFTVKNLKFNWHKLFGFVEVHFRGNVVTMNNADSSENKCAFFTSIDDNTEVVPGKGLQTITPSTA